MRVHSPHLMAHAFFTLSLEKKHLSFFPGRAFGSVAPETGNWGWVREVKIGKWKSEVRGGWEGGGVWTALCVVRLRVLEFEQGLEIQPN